MFVLDQSKQTSDTFPKAMNRSVFLCIVLLTFSVNYSDTVKMRASFPKQITLVRDPVQESEDRQQATASVSDTKGGKYRTPRYAIL